MRDALSDSGREIVPIGRGGTLDATGVDPIGRPEPQIPSPPPRIPNSSCRALLQCPGERGAQRARGRFRRAGRDAREIKVEATDSDIAARLR